MSAAETCMMEIYYDVTCAPFSGKAAAGGLGISPSVSFRSGTNVEFAAPGFGDAARGNVSKQVSVYCHLLNGICRLQGHGTWDHPMSKEARKLISQPSQVFFKIFMLFDDWRRM